ncbi:two-component system nitrogen regulation sensor histidine kinase GlnL [Rubricella aquisinus]|uniref:histidine kinase n=1 Tax=Rubricella aquisinus TaxID=2028108 RepID=A0A840X289_9RHOB|nr:ATP-binding protein [Rubricella aquisinus]MBB5514787.1 two-component system nitrogen regulation sensor histidine kinase GlnL [Rubricella aquisinus]
MTAFEPVWNAIPYPAFVIDKAGVIVSANIAAEHFAAQSQRALVGRKFSRFCGEDGALMDLVGQVRRAGVSFAQHDIDIMWLDMPPRTAHIHAAPVYERGEDILILIQPRSIAEKMDRSLSHRSAARTVTGMAAMLAHEIKNPLAGISGAAQLLEMNLSEADQELTTLIREETARISKLLDRVEHFGDLRPTARQPVNVHDILNRAKLSAAAGFAKHVRFIEEYDPSLPPTAGDKDQLMQVILNLIKNAAEATPAVGGIITLRTAYRPGVTMALPGGGRESLPLQISISDNGKGVPEDLKKDLFEPFVSSKAAGSGLGLALVSKVMADHGGVIEYDSDPGWTTFRMMLPVWKEPRMRKGAS